MAAVSGLRWFDDDQNNDAYHEGGYNLIDNTIEFVIPGIPVSGEILHQPRKKAVDSRQDQHQRQFRVKPARRVPMPAPGQRTIR